jgi:hypothetical protein
MIMKRLKYPLAVLICLLALSTAAYADLLNNHSIALDYVYGTDYQHTSVYVPNSFTVNVPGQIPDMLLTDPINASVNFYDASIVINIINGFFSNLGFNGPHIYDAANSIDSFTSVSLNTAATTSQGFNSGRIFFDADNIWINFSGLADEQHLDGIVSLDLTASSVVPEPCTFLLFSGGLVGLVVFKKRVRKV